MSEFVGIPHDVDRADAIALDLEGHALRRPIGAMQDDAGQVVDEAEADRGHLGKALLHGAGDKTRRPVRTFNHLQRRRHLSSAIGDEPNVVCQQFQQRIHVIGVTPAAELIGSTVRLFDPLAYVASLLCIIAACVCAALIPATRAGRIEPLQALRKD